MPPYSSSQYKPYILRPHRNDNSTTIAPPTTPGSFTTPFGNWRGDTTTNEFIFESTTSDDLVPDTTGPSATTEVTTKATGGLDAGAIAGIVIGCALFVAVVVAVVYVVLKRTSKSTQGKLDLEQPSAKKPSISSPQSALDQDGYMVPIESKFYKLDQTQKSQPYTNEDDYVVPVEDVYYEIPASLPSPPEPPKQNFYETADPEPLRRENTYTVPADDKGYLDLRGER